MLTDSDMVLWAKQLSHFYLCNIFGFFWPILTNKSEMISAFTWYKMYTLSLTGLPHYLTE